MYSIKAIYDGKNFKPKQPISVSGKYEVVITFLEPMEEDSTDKPQIDKCPISDLRGFLKDKVVMSDDFNDPLDEMKEYM